MELCWANLEKLQLKPQWRDFSVRWPILTLYVPVTHQSLITHTGRALGGLLSCKYCLRSAAHSYMENIYWRRKINDSYWDSYGYFR